MNQFFSLFILPNRQGDTGKNAVAKQTPGRVTGPYPAIVLPDPGPQLATDFDRIILVLVVVAMLCQKSMDRSV